MVKKTGGNPPHLHSCYQYKHVGGNHNHTSYQYKHVGGKRKTNKHTKSKYKKSKKSHQRKTLKKGFFARLFKL